MERKAIANGSNVATSQTIVTARDDDKPHVDIVDHIKTLSERCDTKLIRGPILVWVAITWILLPYMLRLSPSFILQITCLCIGLFYCIYDLFPIVERKIRRGLQHLFDAIVLDDVLKSIYDPDAGLIACIVGTVVGTSSMYALRLDADQRTRLVQSSLWVSNEEARSILYQPGGCKTLLPDSMQRWLAAEPESNEMKSKESPIEDDDGQESDSSETECKSVPEDAKEKSSETVTTTTSRGLDFPTEQSAFDEHTKEEDKNESTAANPSNAVTEDPMTVMFSIVSEMVYEKLKQQAVATANYISITKAENIAISTTIALGAQLLCRRRASTTFVGSLCALILSGTTVTAVAGIIAKEVALGNIRDKRTFQLALQSMAMRILERIKRVANQNLPLKRILAIIVLVMAGRKSIR